MCKNENIILFLNEKIIFYLNEESVKILKFA